MRNAFLGAQQSKQPEILMAEPAQHATAAPIITLMGGDGKQAAMQKAKPLARAPAAARAGTSHVLARVVRKGK